MPCSSTGFVCVCVCVCLCLCMVVLAGAGLMPTGLHCLLVGGIHKIVTCDRPGMAGNVTESQNHGEG